MKTQKYPPSNLKELRACLLEYMCSDIFLTPINEKLLFDELECQYQEYLYNLRIPQAKTCMKNLSIESILKELQKSNGIKIEVTSFGVKKENLISEINIEKIKQLNREHQKDRPTSLPANVQEVPIVPQQKQSSLANKVLFDLLNNPSALQKIESDKQIKNFFLKQLTATEKAVDINKNSKRLEYCENLTREKCNQASLGVPCQKSHFRKIIRPHTDPSLGNCSYLDTCRHMEYCRFIHFELEENNVEPEVQIQTTNDREAQWINCDLRTFDFRVLGKFNVIMADPPWDIHMSLPYGTMKDKEMKSLRIDILQEEGLIFLWVTGRAMELGRECLQIWGYRQVEEIIWVKTNQLQRIIRTGRTGHWLNHSKEHCLVGIKGNPKINQFLDCDVIVSEVRETSRKPDEIYLLIDRMFPGGKNLEIFGRPHNCRNGWLTLGNQLEGVYLEDEDITKRYSETYPETDISEATMKQNQKNMKDEIINSEKYHNHIQNPFQFRQQQQQKNQLIQSQIQNGIP